MSFFVCFFPLNENIRMLKVEIFKQKTTLFLAATKLWLFYKKIVFFLSFITIRTMSNGLAPACYFVFSCWIYSSWIAAVREGSAGLASILLLPISGAQHMWLGRKLCWFCCLHYVQTLLVAQNKSLLLF